MVCPGLQYFSIISHKRHDFLKKKKVFDHKMCFEFLYNFCLKDSHSKGTATLEPEPIQHRRPTFVWVYIADTCGYI